MEPCSPCVSFEWSDEMSGEGWLGVTVRVSARPPASPAATPRQARPPRPAGSSSRHGSHTSPVSASDPTLGTANDPRSRPSSSLSLTGRDRSGPCPGPHRDPTDDSTRIGDNLFGERMGTMAGQDRSGAPRMIRGSVVTGGDPPPALRKADAPVARTVSRRARVDGARVPRRSGGRGGLPRRPGRAAAGQMPGSCSAGSTRTTWTCGRSARPGSRCTARTG